jgi:thiazole synthase ThiGH ThiG subunit
MPIKSIKSYWSLGNRKISSRLFVPTTRERLKTGTQGLALNIAAQVIIKSGTQFFVIGTSTTCQMGPSVAQENNGPVLYEVMAEVERQLSLLGEERQFHLLINTSRAVDAQEAADRALAFHEQLYENRLLSTNLIKLEVYDPKTAAPVDDEVMKAAEIIHDANPKIEIMPFINKRADLATELVRRFNCPAVRVFGTPIGSGQGIGNEQRFVDVIEAIPRTPIIIEGGIGKEHLWRAFELGAQAALVNAAIAKQEDPVAYAIQMREISDRFFGSATTSSQPPMFVPQLA